jgi:hypothetical protein
MKKQIVLLILLLTTAVSAFCQNSIIIDNSTGQRITKLEYWLGPESQVQNPGLIFKSKGAVEKDKKDFKIDESFHKTKRNAILIRATLSGGGYITSQYNISKQETSVKIQIFNPCEEVPKDNYQSVINKFKEFNFDKDYLKLNHQNALLTILGALYLYDSTGTKILYIVTPKELKSNLSEICLQNNLDYAQGTFSSETAVSGNLNLPFVSINSAFSNGDVAKFLWSIENVGECVWSPSNNDDLATLFSNLSQKTKDALLRTYIDNPGSKLKFINKVFLIGRIEIETEKAKQINTNAELTGSSFVTAKGNYTFVDALRTKNVINTVVTKFDGYFVIGLLSNEYLLVQAQAKNKLTEKESQRVKEEFNYLLTLYPDLLTPTTDVELMKKQIIELNKKNGEISYLRKPEGNTTIPIQEIIEKNQGVGELKSTENK